MNEASYLMLNEKEVVFDQCVEPLGDFHSHTDLQIIRGFLDETEVAAYETIAQQVRREMKLDQLLANVGQLPLPLDYKYIMHHKGRYDVWNIQPLTALSLKRPPQIKSASCLLQSLGFLFVDPFVIDDGKWHQAVGTYDQNNINLFVDGTLQSTTGSTLPIIYNIGRKFQIGYHFESFSYFDGKIAKASVYNRALSAQEVQQNFNALRGRFGI